MMGKDWDSWVPGPEVWRDVFRVLKPGGTALVFAGTRTQDLMGIALRLAGFELTDCCQWLYGSGFPKSLDIGKAIDKRAGAEREVVGPNLHSCAWRAPGIMHIGGQNARPQMEQRMVAEGNDKPPITAPATDLAREWDGWGTALKPSHEPIILARKPCEGSFAANAEKWGVAGIWVDGCRVAAGGDVCGASGRWGMKPEAGWNPNSVKSETTDAYEHTRGRWPANTVFSHAPGCRCVGEERVKAITGGSRGTLLGTSGLDGLGTQLDVQDYADADGLETVAKWLCVEGCPVKALGEQSGVSGNGKRVVGGPPRSETAHIGQVSGQPRTEAVMNVGDRGTATRFFPQFDAEPFLYCAKASRAERERGLDELDAMPPRPSGNGFGECTIFNGENGNAEWKAKNPSKPTRNPHPTVKPLALMQWLCRLTKTPTGGIVLDPFGGSGTTAVAALLEGREFILIEQDPAYCEIARARIADAIRNHQPALQEVAEHA